MPDRILRTNDKAIYYPPFGRAIVTVSPGTLTGTAKASKAVASQICVDGDEKSAFVPGCPYVAPPYVIPGVGTLHVHQLKPDQLSKKTTSRGIKIMLKGVTYKARFEVTSPAKMPTSGGPVPDPTPQYFGEGEFQTTNQTVEDKG